MGEPAAKWVDGARAAVAFVGLASLSYGSFLAWRPAGFIVPGILLLGASVIGALRQKAAP